MASIEPEGYFAVFCRSNTIGKPDYSPARGFTARWDYNASQVLHIVRPEDGRPAQKSSVRCAQCSKDVKLSVLSVAATKARQRALKLIGLSMILVFVLGAVLLGNSVNAVDAANAAERSATSGMVGIFVGLFLCAAAIGSGGGIMHAVGGFLGVSAPTFTIARHQLVPVELAEEDQPPVKP